MSKKSDVVLQLMKRVQLRWPLPENAPQGESLLERGMVVMLLRRLSRPQAEALVTAMRASYEDWNEVRVCQTQELVVKLRENWKGAAVAEASMVDAVNLAREYLQEVFQRTHGLDLAEFREDPTAAGKILPFLSLIGMATGGYLLWMATGGQLVAHSALVRVLDRLGLVQRSGSSKKGRELIEPIVPEGKLLEFLTTFSEVADRWCDSRKPLCHECVLVQECKYGKKAYREYQIQVVRLEAQRKRDEARRVVLERKESARLAREEAKARKQAEAEAAKRAREAERKRLVDERKAAAAKQAAERKAELLRKANEKKSAKAAAKPAKAAKATVKPVKKPEAKKAPAAKKKPESGAKKGSKPASKPARR